jgi:chaperonin GroES
MTKRIETLVGETNIVNKLDEKTLSDISGVVDRGFDIDKESRSGWEKTNKEAMDIAEQVSGGTKTFPFKNPSDVRYPLIAISSLQFAARAYPEFVKSPDIVKTLVVGEDEGGVKAAKALRIGQHMSWQLLREQKEWEENTDRLLAQLPIVGCEFKKTYFSNNLGRNVSEFIQAKDLVINYFAKSMETAPRMSHVFTLYPNEIVERIRGGVFKDFDYGNSTSTKDENEENVSTDPDQKHVFYEQHTWYDLDDDGYKEPYIVTFHKDTKKVVRIVARFRQDSIKYGEKDRIKLVTPDQYFTKFPFLPSINGSIYDRGFGQLLGPINSSISSLVNQLIDSGTLYNSNSGFLGKGIQLGRGRGGGNVKFGLNEWKPIGFTGDDLRKNIVPLPVKEPSLVLFNMLGFMVSTGERLSSVTEILTGDQSNEAERPTTTLARIEQGLKVFSSIHKRLYRSFTEEYTKLFNLNSRFLQPQNYFQVLDTPQSIPKEDYDPKSFDVVPVADPNETTSTQKLIKGQIWLEQRGTGFDDQEINRRFAVAMQEPEPEKLLAKEIPPDPKIEFDNRKITLEEAKFDFEMFKWEMEESERNAKVMRLIAQAEKDIAAAEAAEPGQQLEMYKAHTDNIIQTVKLEQAERKEKMAQQKQAQAKQGATSGNKTS